MIKDMSPTLSDALDDRLCRWHQWARAQRKGIVRGFNHRALVVGEYKISRQYDDTNGALDDDLDRSVMRSIDFEVSQMTEPFRSAIYANAMALVVGVEVFTSPRLPEDREERQVVIGEARGMICRRLQLVGIIY